MKQLFAICILIIWTISSMQAIDNNTILYTTTNGEIVEPHEWGGTFGANIISNSYENGLGIIKFDGDVTSVGDEAFMSLPLSSITLPESVVIIGDAAFSGCPLSSINMQNVTVIGEEAFCGCLLISVFIPKTVARIGTTSFFECKNLNSIIVDPDNAYFDSRNNCNAIIETSSNNLIVGCKNTIIPNNVTGIGSKAFSNLSLTSVFIPNSVTSIGDSAFYKCPLKSIFIPNSVSNIGAAAFWECYDLNSIIVDPNNAYFDSRNNCNAIIETATNTLIAGCSNSFIPEDISSIGDYAFYNIIKGSFTIPNCVTSIGNYAFVRCFLTNFTIPSSVTNIGLYAFKDCYLQNVFVSWNDPRPMPNFFGDRDCSSCVLFVPNGTKSKYAAASGWKDFGNIVEDVISNNVIYYTSPANQVVTPNNPDAFGANIVSNVYENGLGVITFDGELTSIGDRAFGLTEFSLSYIKMPNSVEYIGYGAFTDRYGLLSKVHISENVKEIGEYAFAGTGLEELTLPNGVESIGDAAFMGCGRLTSITIPASVSNIGNWAFSN